jgi:hypothetical protein
MKHMRDGGKNMTGHHLEAEEDIPLWEAIKKAGAYLDHIEKHDLRYLSKDELLMFGSIVISGFAEHRAEWFQNRRHPDDKPALLNDEIPF